jgi:hypothetical protein
MISPRSAVLGASRKQLDEATRKNLREFYKMAIPADSVARAIAYAIEQPAEVEIDEVVLFGPQRKTSSGQERRNAELRPKGTVGFYRVVWCQRDPSAIARANTRTSRSKSA